MPDNEQIKYMLAPLETIDATSLTRLAEELKASPAKQKKALAAFLLRYLDTIAARKKPAESLGSDAGAHGLVNLKGLR